MSPRRRWTLAAASLGFLVLAACATDGPSVLEPRSEAGERIERLWWLTFWTSVVVVVFVTAFLLRAVWRGRAAPGPVAELDIDKRPVRWGERFIVVAGLIVSGAILAATFAYSLRDLNALAEPP
ncbi:MAG: hypothetical protein M3144_11430, partial [Actinomycetota bacterium]|nr:hypothetical protein [Actinomycetota bacterium]